MTLCRGKIGALGPGDGEHSDFGHVNGNAEQFLDGIFFGQHRRDPCSAKAARPQRHTETPAGLND